MIRAIYGAALILKNGSRVTGAEFIAGDKPHPKGADGSVWVARVIWSGKNKLLADHESRKVNYLKKNQSGAFPYSRHRISGVCVRFLYGLCMVPVSKHTETIFKTYVNFT